MLCAICTEVLRSPVSLPCGHIYCRECIIPSNHKSTTRHRCPTCRHPYRIVNINPSRIPTSLLPQVFPTLKRSRLDIDPPLSDPADIKAENDMLRLSSQMWRNRAEAHAAATIGILSLVRSARDQALRWKSERDALQLRYNALKRKLEQPDDTQFSAETSFFTDDFTTPVPSPTLFTTLDSHHNW